MCAAVGPAAASQILVEVRHVRHHYHIDVNVVPQIVYNTISLVLNVLKTSYHAVKIFHKMILINITCYSRGVKISRLITSLPRCLLAWQSWV